jgi:hypothetical protein
MKGFLKGTFAALMICALASITAKEVVVNSPRLGTLHIDRKSVVRLARRKEATDMIYSGPRGLTDWQQPLGKTEWREEAGELVTDRAGAALFGKVPLPAQASIDIDLSWKNKPDFVLAFGASGAEENSPAAGARAGQTSAAVPYSIATLNMSLIACRETTQDADIARERF